MVVQMPEKGLMPEGYGTRTLGNQCDSKRIRRQAVSTGASSNQINKKF